MYTALSDFCETNNENAEAVLFSMLLTTLKGNGKPELAKVEHLWTEQADNVFLLMSALLFVFLNKPHDWLHT